MTTFLASRTVRRRGILFTILVAISLVLMAISNNGAVMEVQRGLSFALRPVQGALDDVATGIGSVFVAVTEMDRLRVENDGLRSENERLAAENSRLAALRRENEQLTALLQLRSGFEFETVTGRVIGRESSEFRRSLTLDVGSDAGVEPGDVVVAAGGALAGRVEEVGPNFARIVLVTDPATTVVGQMASSGATGEVTGELGSVLEMAKIDATEEVTVGDEVITAGIVIGEGIRSPYPHGLVIGQVVEVQRDPNSVVQTAYLLPAADLSRLAYVFVILDYEGSLPEPGQRPVDCEPPGEEPEDPGTLPVGEDLCATPSPPVETIAPPSPGPGR